MFVIIAFAFWSLIVWLVFNWRTLPQSLQTWTPRLLLVAGLACMLVALILKGEYTQEVALFIGGPNPYTVETITHSYAFLSIGIGIAMLAIFALAKWGWLLPVETPLRKAFALTLTIIILRVYLEKLGLPLNVVTFFGIIWLIVPLAVYFGVEAAKAGSQRKFWAWLFGYAFGTRAFIIAIMLLATSLELGTHFDNSSVTTFTAFGNTFQVAQHSWEQYWSLIIFPQIFLWMSATLLAGVLFGWPCYLILMRRYKRLAFAQISKH